VKRIISLTTLIVAVLALLAGCTSRLSPYDEAIAAGLAELESRHTRFFDELQQTAGTPAGAWERHTGWYQETRAEIAALRARTASFGVTDDPTAGALELLDRSVEELEQAHAEGLAREEIPILRTLFDSQLHMLIELEAAKKQSATEVTP
jgi:hypothetical protein